MTGASAQQHPRSSANSPLRIDAMPCGRGMLGMTLCPGKSGESVHGAPWARDLAIDLQAVREWGAHCMVSILEPARNLTTRGAGPGRGHAGIRYCVAHAPDHRWRCPRLAFSGEVALPQPGTALAPGRRGAHPAALPRRSGAHGARRLPLGDRVRGAACGRPAPRACGTSRRGRDRRPAGACSGATQAGSLAIWRADTTVAGASATPSE